MSWLSVSIAVSLIEVASLVAAPVDYEATIKPLLKQRCASCHGALKQEADLRLDAGALIPRESRSEILKRVASRDESERMPPDGSRLTAEQIAALQAWIAADAPFPKDEIIPVKPSEHWSFPPVKAVEDRCHVSDLHVTMLHLMRLDHTRLSYRHLGLDQRLTGVEERHIITKALS